MTTRRLAFQHVIDFTLHCPACAYDLRGLSVTTRVRCPECGDAFELMPLMRENRFDVRIAIFQDAAKHLVRGAKFLAWAIAFPVAPIIVPAGLFFIRNANQQLRGLLRFRADDDIVRRWRRLEIRFASTDTAITLLNATVPFWYFVATGWPTWHAIGLATVWFLCAAVATGAVTGFYWKQRKAARGEMRELIRQTSAPDDHPILRAVERPHSLTFAMTHGLSALVSDRFTAAISLAANIPLELVDPAVRPSGDPKFGDYQCNAPMALAKRIGQKPRDLAAAIVAAAKIDDIAEPLEIAGPGFINVRLRAEFVGRLLGEIGTEVLRRDGTPGTNTAGPHAIAESTDRVGLQPVANPQRVVVDYSSPNIAKQMHVGHLRSTIIGDVLARVLAFDGNTVIRQNHVGDWGTQFGMLIEHYAKHPFPTGGDHDEVLTKIEDDYRTANERFKSDPAFADAARLAVGRLQSGDATAREVWRRVCAASAAAFTDIYRRLNVQLVDDDIRGESFYNDKLAPTIDLLRESLPTNGAASSNAPGPRAECRDDAGAVCVFYYKPDGEPLYKNPEGAPLPLIVRKSDGAYLYASTDLAAIRFRTGTPPNEPDGLGAKRVIYVVGAPTKLHLEMVFTCVRLAGWVDDDVKLEHVSFGQVLGEDRKLLRTRSGGAVKLKELLDEAERRAYDVVSAKHSGTEESDSKPDEAELRRIARAVGIGAVKWFDLSRDRNADYVFNWDHMLAMQGNTAPYMMYAYTRIRSIYRKAIEKIGSPDVYASSVAITPNDPAERALAIRLARFGDAIDVVARDLTPHVLCNYLYELAGEFMRFYEACPVIAAPDDATRLSRLRLCDLAARTLRTGMGLLGIEVLERM